MESSNQTGQMALSPASRGVLIWISVKRHPERKACLFRRRRHADGSAMGTRDFGGDVEPQSQALPGVARGNAVERLKQPVHCFGRDRVARIADRQLEFSVLRRRAYTNGTGGRAVGYGIAEQIGKQLPDAAAIAVDRLRQIEPCLDFSPGRAGAK